MGEMRFARFVLIASALVFGAVGLLFLVRPAPMAAAIGVHLQTVAAVNDVRAVYGGLQIAIGAFLAYCALSPDRVRIGLVCLVLAFGGLAAGRGLSAAIDGMPDALALRLWAAELAAVAAGALALLRLGGSARG